MTLKTPEERKAKVNLWRREMREVAKDIGNCTNCFNRPASLGYFTCAVCRYNNIRNSVKRKKERGMKNG